MPVPNRPGPQAAFAATRCCSTGTSFSVAGGWALHLLRVEGGKGRGDGDTPGPLGSWFRVVFISKIRFFKRLETRCVVDKHFGPIRLDKSMFGTMKPSFAQPLLVSGAIPLSTCNIPFAKYSMF